MRSDSAMSLMRRYREEGQRHSPVLDEAALQLAQRCRHRLSEGLHLSLTWDQWTQLTAILQTEIAPAIRHAVFEAAPFPEEDGA